MVSRKKSLITLCYRSFSYGLRLGGKKNARCREARAKSTKEK